MNPKALELPTVSPVAVAVFFAILTLLLLFFLLLKLRQHKIDANTAAWLNLYHYALRRGVLGKQMAPIKAFFATLNRDEKEQIPGNRTLFRRLFLPFLEKYRGISEAQKVELIEKITPETEVSIEIRVPSDLHLGEACALEFNREHRLGFLVKMRGNQALFSLRNWVPADKLSGTPITVYAYRHGHGGYTMKGVINKAAPNGMIVDFTGEISFRGNEHLMAFLEWDLYLSQWPPPEISTSSEGDSEGVPQVPVVAGFHATSEKVSDRAMLVRLNEPVPLKVLQSQELWQLETHLPDGHPIELRVKLIPSPKVRGRYILKYMDIDEVTRNLIWETIKQNNPVRELIH